MTDREITEEFLRLFSRNWNDATAHRGFRELRERVSGVGDWQAIIDARLLALEKKTEESIALLNDVLAQEPRNVYASLMLGSVLAYEKNQPEESFAIVESLLQQGFQGEAPSQFIEALTLLIKGSRLGQMGKNEEAIRTYDELILRFRDTTELPLLEQVATAMGNKGVALSQMGKSEEEIRVYDDIVQRFAKASELTLLVPVAKALVNKGFTLGRMGKAEEAIRVCDDVIQRFDKATQLPLLQQLANALVNKAWALDEMGKHDEEIKVYDDLIQRFAKASELPLLEQVAKAILKKGFRLSQIGKAEEAIRVCDDVTQRFDKSTEVTLMEQVGIALLFKANCLLDADRVDEAQLMLSKAEKEYLGVEKLREELQAAYTYVRSRFASRGRLTEEQRTKPVFAAGRADLAPGLMGYLTEVLGSGSV